MFPIISPAIDCQEETTNALFIYLQPSEILTYLTSLPVSLLSYKKLVAKAYEILAVCAIINSTNIDCS